jgi:hypothetical protein
MKHMLKRSMIVFITFCLCSSCQTNSITNQEHKQLAEQLIRSVYGGDTSQIDSLVSDNVVCSYPIFEELFGSYAIRGPKQYKNFAVEFGRRWSDPKITFHEAIAEDKSVVLVWSFSAIRMNTEQDSSVVAGQEYSWGGITLVQFDESGKINMYH